MKYPSSRRGLRYELLDANGGDLVLRRLGVAVAVRRGDLVEEDARRVKRGVDFTVFHAVADFHGQIRMTLLAPEANGFAFHQAKIGGVGRRELQVVGGV